MGAFSNMDYELQNSEATVSDAFIHTIPSFAKSHQKISCHAINSRQLIYLNWWLSPCSIIVLHTDRHNLTCSGAASFNMLANSTEMLTSG